MRTPGFTADASLYKARETYGVSGDGADLGGLLQVWPQLGFGGGVTYPPGGDDCYYCVQWVRVPCGLGLG